MMYGIEVHPRVTMRHPEISQEDVLGAWNNCFAMVLRETTEKDFYVAVGSDGRGRLIEMVGASEEDGHLLIFHAMTPPSRRTLTELGLMGRHL